MTHSYIGITGFISETQVTSIIPQILKDTPRKLMLGVLVSYDTLSNPTKYPQTSQKFGRFINISNIKNIFDLSHEIDQYANVLNIVHYCDSQKRNLFESLEKLIYISGENLHGFQLNMRWPDYQIIKNFKNKYSDKIIILQIEKQDFVDLGPEEMSDKLAKYTDVAEYVILDMSMGAGIQLDAHNIMEYAYPISIKTGLNIVFAGGLCASNINILKPIVKRFPSASIDAEGRLMGLSGALDVQKTSDYLQRALKLFQK